jgi:predicted Zn-dependent protease
MVATQLQDAEGFSAALQRLEQQHADTGLDHVLYWRMLAGLGRNKEAVELARAYAYPPTSAAEVARLTDAYSLLGLKDQALQLMQRYAPQFGYAEDIWISYANLLIDLKRWDELRATALEIRHQESVRERLEGFSFFLEGRADYEQSRSAPAAAAFDRAAGCAFPNPLLGLAAARQLVRAGFPGPARLILGKLETQLADNPDFREAAFNAALLLKDEEWLFKVARQQFQSQPRNAIYLNRYAAAFLIQRAQPEEAIKLTLQLVTAFPNSAAANVNHALALLLNRREAEAERLLGRLKLEALRDTEIHAYHLARFELCLLQGKPAEAWLAYDKIDQQALFPGQKRWIEECRAKLPPRGAAAP